MTWIICLLLAFAVSLVGTRLIKRYELDDAAYFLLLAVAVAILQYPLYAG